MGISVIGKEKYPGGGDEADNCLALSDLAALSVAWVSD